MSRWAVLICGLALLVIACGGKSITAAPGTQPGLVAVDVEPSAGVPIEAINPAPVAPAPSVAAADRPKVVVLDPGHGGPEVGSSSFGVVEKESNLDMALRVEQLLRAQGAEVVLTRRSDARAAEQQPGQTATRSDLQARVDLANAASGDVFVSIHSNGSTDTNQRGVEAWYDSTRSFAVENKELAGLLLSHVIDELRGFGYAAVDRGLYDGACFRYRNGRCITLFVIGGARETRREDVERQGGDPQALGLGSSDVTYSRPTNMPAALVELLIVSNPSDAAVLRQEGGRQAMARGLTKAIMAFLGLSYRDA